LGFLYDKKPVSVFVMIFEQKLPGLFFLAGIALYGIHKGLEGRWNNHRHFGKIQVFGKSLGLKLVKHLETPF
jgi:hypothetical protein